MEFLHPQPDCCTQWLYTKDAIFQQWKVSMLFECQPLDQSNFRILGTNFCYYNNSYNTGSIKTYNCETICRAYCTLRGSEFHLSRMLWEFIINQGLFGRTQKPVIEKGCETLPSWKRTLAWNTPFQLLFRAGFTPSFKETWMRKPRRFLWGIVPTELSSTIFTFIKKAI